MVYFKRSEQKVLNEVAMLILAECGRHGLTGEITNEKISGAYFVFDFSSDKANLNHVVRSSIAPAYTFSKLFSPYETKFIYKVVKRRDSRIVLLFNSFFRDVLFTTQRGRISFAIAFTNLLRAHHENQVDHHK